MLTEKRYPNGFLTADYVFDQYEQLNPVERAKVREMIHNEQENEYKQANYTVNNAYRD
jgi:hypothetical protein